MHHATLSDHLIELQPAGFRDAETVAEHQQQQPTVAGLVAAALDGFKETFKSLFPVAVGSKR